MYFPIFIMYFFIKNEIFHTCLCSLRFRQCYNIVLKNVLTHHIQYNFTFFVKVFTYILSAKVVLLTGK